MTRALETALVWIAVAAVVMACNAEATDGALGDASTDAGTDTDADSGTDTGSDTGTDTGEADAGDTDTASTDTGTGGTDTGTITDDTDMWHDAGPEPDAGPSPAEPCDGEGAAEAADAGPDAGDTCCDGIDNDSDGLTDGADPDCPRNVMFVTSGAWSGDFGGLAAADALCQSAAESAGLPPNTYLAWLSDFSDEPRYLLAGARGWVLADGRPFADALPDLYADEMWAAPDVDESGSQLPLDDDDLSVFTNTRSDGSLYSYSYCGGWMLANPTLHYLAGSPFGTGLYWTVDEFPTCDQPSRLYCFGVDHATQVLPTAGGGRIAFVTAAAFVAGGGLDAADALCQAEAEAAGLPSPSDFLALLATAGAAAADRFPVPDGSANWVRADGVPITAYPAQLFESIAAGEPLLAPIAVDATGAVSPHVIVWTGAPTPSEAPGTYDETCDDWTATSGATGHIGRSARVDADFFDHLTASCNSGSTHIYCLAASPI
jgi:hypothetical protein